MSSNNSVFTASGSDDDKLGRFVAGSSVSVVASVLAGLFAFSWAWLMTRMLGKTDYGILGPYLNLFWILTALTNCGLQQTIITFVSHHFETDPKEAARVASAGNRMLVLIGGAFVLASVAAILALRLSGRMETMFFALSLLMCLAVLSRQLFFGTTAAMSGLQRMEFVSLANITFSIMLPLTSLVFLFLARTYGEGVKMCEIIAGASGIATSALISYLVSLLILRRTILPPGVLYAFRSPMGDWKKLLTFGWVSNVAIVGHTVIGLVPPIYLSYIMAMKFGWFGATLHANLEKAGIFSAAFTYAMAPAMIIGLTFALIPAMSEAEGQNNRPLMNRYFNVSIKYCVTLLAMITAVYGSVAGKLVSLVTGGNFPAATMQPIVFYLEVSMAVSSMFILCLSMLVALKRPAVAAVTVSIMLVLEIAAMTLAGRITGDIHIVAWSMIATIFTGLSILLIYLIFKVGLKLDFRLILPPVAAGFAAWAAARFIASGEGLLFLGSFVAIPVVFLIVAGLLGGVDHEDLDILRLTMKSLRAGFLSVFVDALEKFFTLSPLYKKHGGAE